MMAMILETARLVLRVAVRSDAAFILELMNESGYINHIGDRGVRTLTDAENYIDAKFTQCYEALGYGLWITQTRDEAIPLGICGFVKRDVLEHPDLGFAYLERFWSQGFALESATAVLRYGRDFLGFSQVFGVTSKTNRASIRLLEKLGFTSDRTILLPGSGEESLLFTLSFKSVATDQTGSIGFERDRSQ
jgi:RimJ/RimL family protein N-acetyltransferase